MLELMRFGRGLTVFALLTLLGCGGKSLETEGGAAGAGAASVGGSAGSVGSGGVGSVVNSAGAGGSVGVGFAGAGGQQGTCPIAEPDEGSPCSSPGLTCRVPGSVSCPETALCGALEVWHIECPIYPAGMDTGTCGCANPVGTATAGSGAPRLHRDTSAICPAKRAPITTMPVPLCNGPDAYCPNYCVQDSDCTAAPNGRCTSTGGSPYACSYDDCFSDADCPNGSYCACRDMLASGANHCVGLQGNCHSDIDCGPGGYCSPSDSGWCGPDYYCHTPADTCLNDSDCAAPNGCNFDATLTHWACGAGCGPDPNL